ncbi:SDR family NAD(P)-dependent oxidoreductase [Phenylobacterium sp. LjRoot225]|uniref:SDR family NAD(P)-dependent oxidoreductase n=1 Tax=Phenylobacterium sp. LjRoot225 TaxID=3342285 RepID=UPI003ED0B469
MDDLTGKFAFVTGASRGIGREIALALAGASVDIAVGCRRTSQEAVDIARAIEAMGRRALVVPVDISDAAGAKEAARLARTLGPRGWYMS